MEELDPDQGVSRGRDSQAEGQSGKNIGVTGSPTLVRSLLRDNLLDELTLMIHPVVVGGGRRIFIDGSHLKRLELVGSKTTSTGILIATYQPR